MRTFRLNKLIRDGVFENMKVLSQIVEHRVLKKPELIKALQDKLLEELGEFEPDSKEPLRELADLQEIIDTLTYLLGANPDTLREIQEAVRAKRGTFNKRIFVETVTLADDDPWVQYYANEPDRFPEIKPHD